MHKCIGLASNIMGQLDAVWRHSHLSLTVKLSLYTSLVQSVLLYGSDYWHWGRIKSNNCRQFTWRHKNIAYFRSTGMISLATTPSGSRQNSPTYRTAPHHWSSTCSIWSYLSSSRKYSGAHNSKPHYQCCQRGSVHSRLELSLRMSAEDMAEADREVDADVSWSHARDREMWRSLWPSLVRRSSEWVSTIWEIGWVKHLRNDLFGVGWKGH